MLHLYNAQVGGGGNGVVCVSSCGQSPSQTRLESCAKRLCLLGCLWLLLLLLLFLLLLLLLFLLLLLLLLLLLGKGT